MGWEGHTEGPRRSGKNSQDLKEVRGQPGSVWRRDLGTKEHHVQRLRDMFRVTRADRWEMGAGRVGES